MKNAEWPAQRLAHPSTVGMSPAFSSTWASASRTTDPRAVAQIKVRQSVKATERPDVRANRLVGDTHLYDPATWWQPIMTEF